MPKQDPEAHMSLGEHLDELRRRLIIAIIGLVPIIAAALILGQKLVSFLLTPAMDALAAHGDARQMILTGPGEGFGTYMKVSMIAAIVVGSPWLIYQLWKFVSPGLYSHERRFVYFLIPLSTFLTIAGVAFLYFYFMPLILRFFLDFDMALGDQVVATAPLTTGVALGHAPVLAADPPADQLGPGAMWINSTLNMLRVCVSVHEGVPTIVSTALKTGVGATNEMRVSEYVQLLLSLTLAFALAFQAPVVVLLLGWVGILNQEILSKYRRHAILVCAVIAAAIAPGDPASMLFLLVPLYILYELGGILLRIFPASRVAGKRETSDDDNDDDRPRGRDRYAPPFNDFEPEEQPDGIEPAGRRE